MIRAARVESLVERKMAEESLRVAGQQRGFDQERARAMSEMSGSVRLHEEAHLAALGGAAGPIVYSMVSGPGGSYASGGSIAVDISPVPGDPAATMRKAEGIRLAAMAPSNPSVADVRTAAAAYQLEAAARREMAQDAQRPRGISMLA